MRKTIAFGTALAMGLGLASFTGFQESAAAPEAAATPVRECLFVDRVNGFNPGARNVIYVEGDGRSVYEFETTEVCPNLKSSFNVALQSRSGDSVVCKGQDVDLIVRETSGQPRRCTVRMVRKMGLEEGRAALKAKS